jgi:hypothetical protein
MRKILLVAMMLMTITGSCLAAGVSSLFASEESTADRFVNVIRSNGDFAQVQSLFVKDSISEKDFKNIQNEVKKNFGAVSNAQLISYNRQFAQDGKTVLFDVMVYLCDTEKGKMAMVMTLGGQDGSVKIAGVQFSKVELVQQGQGK